MPFAVIKTGGKQYLVQPGQKLKIEKLPQKEGEEIVFEQVLLVENDGKVEIGTPLVNAKVKAKIVQQARGKKLVIFRYKKKKREKKKKGHRQPFSEVEITSIKR